MYGKSDVADNSRAVIVVASPPQSTVIRRGSGPENYGGGGGGGVDSEAGRLVSRVKVTLGFCGPPPRTAAMKRMAAETVA